MILITQERIDIDSVIQAVQSPKAGAITTFDGRVRNHSRGKRVKHLYYEAYTEMALTELTSIRESALKKWPLDKVAIVHRLGQLEIGETSVFIAVSSAHRADAFAACQYVIDTLKESVPIWKKEFFEDGEEWVEPTTKQTTRTPRAPRTS
ncbi:MAG TPA: molybdenum cofactor biosynthesis protein MoaE [Acidobacteriota bacterium]|nr:molybdenum cofactor biosynthesis protein MoaE [Acidobacteriota bacterium]